MSSNSTRTTNGGKTAPASAPQGKAGTAARPAASSSTRATEATRNRAATRNTQGIPSRLDTPEALAAVGHVAPNPRPRPAATSVAQSAAEPSVRATRTRNVSAAPKVRVRALRMGYYEHIRRRPGDIFLISGEKYTAEDKERRQEAIEASDVKTRNTVQIGELRELGSWMEILDGSNNQPISRPKSGNEALQVEHDRILARNIAAKNQTPYVDPHPDSVEAATGDRDVLADDGFDDDVNQNPGEL